MKRKVSFIFILSGLLLASLTPIALNHLFKNGNPLKGYVVKRETIQHLKEEGYSVKDLQVIQPILTNWKLNGTSNTKMKVIFKDEPAVTYYYLKLKKEKEIVQLCAAEELKDNRKRDIPKNPKHLENNCFKKA